MFFGINGFEMVILVVVALLVIGPHRLPEYTEKLKEFVKGLRRLAEGAKENVRRDFGDDLAGVDWQKLDPRQYDPRRIVKEALAEEDAAIRAEAGTKNALTSVSEAPAASPETSPAGQGGGANPAGGASGTNPGVVAAGLSPLERFSAQAALRNKEQAAPVDLDAT